MSAIRFYVEEVLLTVLFVGIFIAVSVIAWNTGGGFFFAQAIVSASIVIPFLYLVVLLMLRQRRVQRQKMVKKSPYEWDE